MPVGRVISLMLAGALVVAAAPRPARPHSPSPTRLPAAPLASNPSLGIIRQAPDFTLLDHQGRVVRLSEFNKGRVVLLSFIYASCPGACPLVTARVAALQARLRAAGVGPARAGLLSITVDPERDTGPVLARYARAFRAREGWRFLTETPERVRPVLAAYDEWTRRQADGDLDHPARLYLIDPRGYVREIYDLPLFDERQALLDIQALLREPR